MIHTVLAGCVAVSCTEKYNQLDCGMFETPEIDSARCCLNKSRTRQTITMSTIIGLGAVAAVPARSGTKSQSPKSRVPCGLRSLTAFTVVFKKSPLGAGSLGPYTLQL